MPQSRELPRELAMDIPKEVEAIYAFVQQKLADLQRSGIAIGLSGGLDSAVTAQTAVNSVGKDKIFLVNMPERDSKPLHKKHARQFARHLGLPLHVLPLTRGLRAIGTYKILPLRFVPSRKLRTRMVNYGKTHFLHDGGRDVLLDRLSPPDSPWVLKGNAYALAKHRLRMVRLYQFAELRNLMVVGAANKTEWLTGTFSKFGVDHCSDVHPFLHIYRTQLETIADYLGIPNYIREKPADPDIVPGTLNKGELMGDFYTTDRILAGLEGGKSLAELYEEFNPPLVDYISQLKVKSVHMRESPYHL